MSAGDLPIVVGLLVVPGVIIGIAAVIRGYNISINAWRTDPKHHKRKDNDNAP